MKGTAMPDGAKRRARRVAQLLLSIAVAVSLAAVGTGCGRKQQPTNGQASTTKPKQIYYCPMHPTYTSDKPGDCPICNMHLVLMEQTTPAEAAPSSSGEMPAKGMASMEHEEHTQAQPAQHEGHVDALTPGGGALTPASPVKGYTPVRISSEKQQLIGVRLAPAEVGPMTKTIRAVGRVDYDESRLHHIHTKVDGWIGKLYVSYTGQRVDEGNPLFSFYSPEIVATQEEYLLALQAAAKAPASDPARDLVSSVERRLLLWDLHGSQLHEIADSGKAKTYVDIAAHATGVVVEKQALEGMRVMPGEELYTIADLSRIWVNAAVYEYELPYVKLGQQAVITLPYDAKQNFTGRISYVYPYLDEKTRTAQVRLEFDNPHQLLKPGMFANVEIEIAMGQQVTIPSDAILDSGDRQLVFVAKGDGLFEPREVHLGQRFAERVAVTDGVSPGESVVVGAQFLIDSESQLRAALAGMGAAGEHRH
jgi:Cu(I)/Ag(I) efflux system membrane fusion protein